MTVSTEYLAHIVAMNTGVDGAYKHSAKQATADAPLLLPEAALKWYDIQPIDRPVPGVVKSLAHDTLTASPLTPQGMGFVLLHRCGADFYFLIVGTWRNSNELWETVFYKDKAMARFAPFTRGGSHIPTFCVWELGPVWHEKQVWERFLTSARDEHAAQAWLDDRFEGAV